MAVGGSAANRAKGGHRAISAAGFCAALPLALIGIRALQLCGAGAMGGLFPLCGGLTESGMAYQ